MLIVFTTVSNLEEAESLARGIIEQKLAGCAQILPQMTSIYVWKGKVEREIEHLLLIKTTEEKYDELEKFIGSNHSYTVPEIVAVESTRVAQPYRRWLEEVINEK